MRLWVELIKPINMAFVEDWKRMGKDRLCGLYLPKVCESVAEREFVGLNTFVILNFDLNVYFYGQLDLLKYEGVDCWFQDVNIG